MTAAEATAAQESAQSAEAFRQYLRYAGPPNLLGSAAMIALYLLFADIPFLYFAGATLLNAGLYAFAYRRVASHGVALAAPIICYGMWGLVLSLSFTEARLLPLAILMAMMPLMAIVPYLSMQRLLRLCLACIAVIAFYALMVATGLIAEGLPNTPRGAVYSMVNWGIPVCVALGCLSLWQTSTALNRSLVEKAAANGALQEVGLDLERRVAARSAELEHARRQLLVARDEALASSRHKSVFLANMSHELRTPLNAILGFSEALAAQIFGPLAPKQQEFVDDIHLSGRRLLNLINNILDQARIESGGYELRPASLNVAAILHEAQAGIAVRAAQLRIGVHVEVDSGLQLTADHATLRKILHNLLDNAVKFTGEGGAVSLRAWRDDATVHLSVSDTGVGLAESERERIFEAFDRGGRQRHPLAGAGLGLTLCAHLVGLQGGRIWVESTPGQGATFHFTVRDAVSVTAS